jgi:hypothetical protein
VLSPEYRNLNCGPVLNEDELRQDVRITGMSGDINEITTNAVGCYLQITRTTEM